MSKKITELSRLTAAANTDVMLIVEDPTSTPTNKYIEVGDLMDSGGFPAGTKMLFHQSAAPTGWTKLTQTGSTPVSFNDVGLRIVTGTITDGVGGTVAFDTAFASQSIPLHTLTTAEMPAHTHTQIGSGAGATVQSGSGISDRGDNTSAATGTTGGGGSHGHGSLNMDVKYIDMIVASKD